MYFILQQKYFITNLFIKKLFKTCSAIFTHLVQKEIRDTGANKDGGQFSNRFYFLKKSNMFRLKLILNQIFAKFTVNEAIKKR